MDEGSADAGTESTSDPAEAPEESTSSSADEQAPAESTSEGEAEADDDEPEEWRNLVRKYESVTDEKQRKAAIGKAYWENTRHASAVQKERDELKARLAELEQESTSRPAKQAEEEPEEVPPDLQAIESRKSALEAKQAAIPAREQQLLVKLGEQDDDIAVLQYKLTTALEEEKPTVKAELRAAKAERSYILASYRSLEAEKSEIKEKLEDLADRKRSASSRLDAEKARQKQADKDAETFRRDFPREIDNYIVRSMDELKIPSDPKLRQDVWESVNDSLIAAYGRMNGADSAGVDHAALVKKYVERYAQRMDLIGRVKFKQFSEKKADVAARLSPTLTTRTPKPKEPERPKMPYEIEVRDERLEKARRGFIGR